MSKVNFVISAEVFETSAKLATRLQVKQSELLSFCLEGLTNPRANSDSARDSFCRRGLTNRRTRDSKRNRKAVAV